MLTIKLKYTAVMLAIVLPVVFLTPSVSGQAIKQNDEKLDQIDVEEHLGDTIPLNLAFIDDHGDSVMLANYFHQGKPVVLILGYYTCPMLCNLVMNGVSDVLKDLAWLPGKEFQIVSVSIDTTETDLVASAKKKNYLKNINRPQMPEDGWMYLTGTGGNAKELADAVGFKYFFIKEKNQYAHPAVLVFLTETGKVSRYLYGIEYNERDFRLGLQEASEGKVGSTLDRIILYCYHYDPEEGSYVPFAGNIMRLGGLATLVVLSAFIGTLWLRDRRKKQTARRNV